MQYRNIGKGLYINFQCSQLMVIFTDKQMVEMRSVNSCQTRAGLKTDRYLPRFLKSFGGFSRIPLQMFIIY